MNPVICQDASSLGNESYDLIVVGGGIQGICLTLEASHQGLRPLLIEAHDFGHAASCHSLRIIHGGFRYLQRMDVRRHRRSRTEQRWFLKTFPDLIEPLGCLMPLCGKGWRRPDVMRIALQIDHWLARGSDFRWPERLLPPGRLLSKGEVMERCPAVGQLPLQGAALWYDALLTNPPRLMMEMLRWAITCGAQAVNYTPVQQILQHQGRVTGVLAKEARTGKAVRFHAPVVIVCTGANSRAMALQLADQTPPPPARVQAFNLLLDVPSLCSQALAVTPPGPRARSWFLVPRYGRTVVGTWYRTPSERSTGDTRLLAAEQILTQLQCALPGLKLHRRQLLAVSSGWLPARGEEGQPISRAAIRDCSQSGGPTGLFAVAPDKLTTARWVAEQALRRIFGRPQRSWRSPPPRPPVSLPLDFGRFAPNRCLPRQQIRTHLMQLVQQEAVQHLDDCLLRRTDWWHDLLEQPQLAVELCQHFGWNAERTGRELQRLAAALPFTENIKWPSLAAIADESAA